MQIGKICSFIAINLIGKNVPFVREVFLGEYIKNRRIELGLTQEALCEGICEPMTISRLENGRQTPSRNNINALLQRLGLPGDRYFALLNKQEQQIEHLKKEIVSCNVQHQSALEPQRSAILNKAYEKIDILEAITDTDDHLLQQFILRTKVHLGQKDGTPYSLDEQLEMLLIAIHLTVPNFDLEEINVHLYCLDEIKVINQIANLYMDKGENRKATAIFRQLLKYIQKHYQNILESAGYLPHVASNYALALYKCKYYAEALEIAELGRQSCVKFGYYDSLPNLLHTMAQCYFHLGDDEASKALFYQAYYIYRATDDYRGAALLQEDAKEYYSIPFMY